MPSSPVAVELSAIEFMGYGASAQPLFRVHFAPAGRDALKAFTQGASGRTVELLAFNRVLASVFLGPVLDVPQVTVTVADSTLAGQLHAVVAGIVRVPGGALRFAET